VKERERGGDFFEITTASLVPAGCRRAITPIDRSRCSSISFATAVTAACFFRVSFIVPRRNRAVLVANRPGKITNFICRYVKALLLLSLHPLADLERYRCSTATGMSASGCDAARIKVPAFWKTGTTRRMSARARATSSLSGFALEPRLLTFRCLHVPAHVTPRRNNRSPCVDLDHEYDDFTMLAIHTSVHASALERNLIAGKGKKAHKRNDKGDKGESNGAESRGRITSRARVPINTG